MKIVILVLTLFCSQICFAGGYQCVSEFERVELTNALRALQDTEFINCEFDVSILEEDPSFLGYVRYYNSMEGNAGLSEFPVSLSGEKNECVYENKWGRIYYEFKLRLLDSEKASYLIHSRTAIYFNGDEVSKVEIATRNSKEPLKPTRNNGVLQGNRSRWTICNTR